MSTIRIEHLARVEGHGGITVELEGDMIKDVRFDVFEGPRLLESLIHGKRYDEVAPTTYDGGRSGVTMREMIASLPEGRARIRSPGAMPSGPPFCGLLCSSALNRISRTRRAPYSHSIVPGGLCVRS